RDQGGEAIQEPGEGAGRRRRRGPDDLMSAAAPSSPARSGESPVAEPLLDVRDLMVDFITPRGPAVAVDGVSFSIRPGEVFGLAGESGCGKSTVAHAIMRLIKAPGRISGGSILFR